LRLRPVRPRPGWTRSHGAKWASTLPLQAGEVLRSNLLGRDPPCQVAFTPKVDLGVAGADKATPEARLPVVDITRFKVRRAAACAVGAAES